MPAPTYSPPAGDNVVINFANTPYTPPAGDNVLLDFGNMATGRRRQILSS